LRFRLTVWFNLGVNANRGLLSRAEFRKAVSFALNRDELVSRAFLARANATLYPFHPEFYRMENMDLTTQRSLDLAEELLDGLGWTRRCGWLPCAERIAGHAYPAGQQRKCRPRSAAALIAEQLRQAGIRVDVVSKSFPSTKQASRPMIMTCISAKRG
jgi:peptide/nickel transport system substrate-binding protein